MSNTEDGLMWEQVEMGWYKYCMSNDRSGNRWVGQSGDGEWWEQGLLQVRKVWQGLKLQEC